MDITIYRFHILEKLHELSIFHEENPVALAEIAIEEFSKLSEGERYEVIERYGENVVC